MPTFKSKHVESRVTKNISCYTNLELNTLDITSSHDGNYIARYLTTLPTNYLTPSIYKDKLELLSASEGWEFKVYDQKELLTIGAEAFLAVSRASKGACIIKMTYKPSSNIQTSKKICLIGKGVCFDTGGVNVKSAEHMYGMQEDMGGSATAIGSILMLSRMGFEYQVECWVAITSNLISDNSYLPNEVITAINGTTIEIVDTDAEGRLILADTLAMASMGKPELIIDYATLTGASLRSVGTRYSTVFSNHSDWYSTLIKAGEVSGERVWPMPMSNDYLNDIKSDIADIKQCSTVPGPDHIHAAKFLEKFVSNNVRWLHIDLAASCNKGGLGAVPSDFTGFGVWFTQELIRQIYLPNSFN
jgi:leucyl aminopeptidase